MLAKKALVILLLITIFFALNSSTLIISISFIKYTPLEILLEKGFDIRFIYFTTGSGYYLPSLGNIYTSWERRCSSNSVSDYNNLCIEFSFPDVVHFLYQIYSPKCPK